MKKFILVYYDDIELKDYFTKCAASVKNYLLDNCPDMEIIEVSNRRCNPVYVESRLSQVNSTEFIFVAYCHGKEDSFVDQYEHPFIKVGENDHMLQNGFVFTNSCLSGVELGPSIVQRNANLFVGYDDETFVYLEYAKVFADCDIFPLLIFLSDGSFNKDEVKTLEKKIKNFYNQKIDEMKQLGAFEYAEFLLDNRDSLVIYFNEDQ